MSYLQHRRKAFRGGVPAPLHWWDLDDLSGGLTDQGNGSNDMTLTNVNATVDTGDAPGSGDSILIDASNEYLHTASDHNWDGSGNAITISAWFKVETQAVSANFIVSWRDQTAGEDRIAQIDVANSSPDHGRFVVFDDQVTEENIVLNGTSGLSPTTPVWFHVVGVFDGVDTCEIFVDASSEGTATNASFANIENTATIPFAIGAASWDKTAPSVHHDGNVWCVGIWDEALDQAQINHLYNSGSGRKFADL